MRKETCRDIWAKDGGWHWEAWRRWGGRGDDDDGNNGEEGLRLVLGLGVRPSSAPDGSIMAVALYGDAVE